ncbi:MAG: UDP-glucose/GDP-mannose dehydrogenase family protein [Deinococcales bacterium]
MTIVVVGAGYVGLTTAAALAWIGHDVWVIESDTEKLATLENGATPFYEPGLDMLLNARRDRIHFVPTVEEVGAIADVAFIAVGTPPDASGAADLGQVHTAFAQILDGLPARTYDFVIVDKSTVPVGTGEDLTNRAKLAGLSGSVHVASNPEFLRQGRAVHDALYPDRMVLGGAQAAIDVLKEVFHAIIVQDFPEPPAAPRPEGMTRVPVFDVDLRSAELAKYAANSYLATRISFINEIANLCDRLGADVGHVASILGADPRIGSHFLHPGIGFGGSCFPKDTVALHHIAATHGYEFEILAAAIRINQAQKYRILEKAEEALGGFEGKTIALLGLSFKPGTDDLREAPSVPLAIELLQRGADVRAHDPIALDRARRIVPAGVRLCKDVEEVLTDADAALLLTEWPEYMALPPELFHALMRRPLLLDGRNALPQAARSAIEYHGIGIPPTRQRSEPASIVPEMDRTPSAWVSAVDTSAGPSADTSPGK